MSEDALDRIVIVLRRHRRREVTSSWCRCSCDPDGRYDCESHDRHIAERIKAELWDNQ